MSGKSTGTIGDKLAVAAARVAGTPVEEAVIKATRTDMLPPKEKHVRALIVSTNDGATMPGDIVDALMRRMEQWEWNVVLKTLMLAHRLIREGNQRFIEDLKYRPTVFPLSAFSDNASALGIKNSPFVRKYATFLEEKVNVYKSLKVEIDKHPHALKDLGVDDIFAKVPKLQSLFNALLNCRIAKADLENGLIISAFTYLLKDSFVLYQALNEGVINLLERFFSMHLSDAQKGLEIYKLFCKETTSLISLYDQCKSFTSSVPDLSKAPDDLLKSMEKYISDLESGQNPGENGDDAADDSESVSADEDDSPAPVVVAKPKKEKKDKLDKKKEKAAAAGGKSKKDKKDKKAKKGAAASKRKESVPTANLLDFDDFDTGSPAPTAAVASPASAAGTFNPFDASPAAPAAAPAAASTDFFDPFSDNPGAGQQATPANVDEKLARIQLVQQMSSSGASDLSGSQSLTPAPANPFAAPQPVSNDFNPFPSQPLSQQPQSQQDGWSNPFA